MKLGFIANNSLPQIEADCRFCVEHGYEGLEFNYWGNFAELTAETVGKMKAVLDRYGVECSTIGLWGWNHISPDDAEREKAQAQLARGFEFAKTLEAPVLITGGGQIPDASVEENAAAFAKVITPYAEQAAEVGIKIALYGFHGGSYLQGIEGYQALWEHCDLVGIKYDAANISHAGQDYLAIARHHGDKIAHVHIKEHVYHDGDVASQPAAGMGDIEFGKLFAFLYEYGYDGYLTMEPHGPKWSREPLRTVMLKLSKRYVEQFLV